MILFFIESHSRYGFLIYGMFFVLFFGLNSDVFHCNNVSSKVTVIFCYVKYSDIWILTLNMMYYIGIHKVLNNGPKNKIITLI